MVSYMYIHTMCVYIYIIKFYVISHYIYISGKDHDAKLLPEAPTNIRNAAHMI